MIMREYYVKYDIYDKLIEKNIDGDKKINSIYKSKIIIIINKKHFLIFQ